MLIRVIALILTFTGMLGSVFAQALSMGFERDRGKTMLRTIKSDLQKNYYDPAFRGMDLEARFKQAEDQMKEATSQNQIWGIIAQALVALDDSHTYFVPPPRPYRIEYGWRMQMIGDKCYVVAVKPGSDAEAKGLKEGDQVAIIDEMRPTRQNLWQILYLYHGLRPREGVNLALVKPDGQQQKFDVIAKIRQGKRVLNLAGTDFFDLIKQQEMEDHLNRHRYHDFTDQLLIWKMPGFDLEPHKVDEVLGKVKNHKALILDLRGNGGGYEDTLLRMVSNFFDKDIKLGDIKRRKETKALVAKTRGSEVYTGKLIVLIDSGSGSAAELFARVVQLEKRGVVIGDVSSGAVMRSKTYSYQHGNELAVPYAASITDADLIMADGKSLERVGVIPDEIKLPTAVDLATKQDPVLAYAASLAGVQITPEKAGALFPIEWRK